MEGMLSFITQKYLKNTSSNQTKTATIKENFHRSNYENFEQQEASTSTEIAKNDTTFIVDEENISFGYYEFPQQLDENENEFQENNNISFQMDGYDVTQLQIFKEPLAKLKTASISSFDTLSSIHSNLSGLSFDSDFLENENLKDIQEIDEFLLNPKPIENDKETYCSPEDEDVDQDMNQTQNEIVNMEVDNEAEDEYKEFEKDRQGLYLVSSTPICKSKESIEKLYSTPDTTVILEEEITIPVFNLNDESMRDPNETPSLIFSDDNEESRLNMSEINKFETSLNERNVTTDIPNVSIVVPQTPLRMTPPQRNIPPTVKRRFNKLALNEKSIEEPMNKSIPTIDEPMPPISTKSDDMEVEVQTTSSIVNITNIEQPIDMFVDEPITDCSSPPPTLKSLVRKKKFHSQNTQNTQDKIQKIESPKEKEIATKTQNASLIESQYDLYIQNRLMMPMNECNNQNMSIYSTKSSVSYIEDLNNRTRACVDKEEKYVINEMSNSIITRIEEILIKLITAIVNNKPVLFEIRKVQSWKNTKLKKNVLVHDKKKLGRKVISLKNKNTSHTFCQMLYILIEIYKNFQMNSSCTKREIYYKNKEMFKTQETVNRQVNNICTMLDVQEQDLGVMATAKGLILGDLQIEFKNGDIVDCIRVQQVPQNVSEIKTFITKTAEFVLIVEKDTVFQKFMNDPMGREFCANMILITGKGYPDISTRLLVKRINDILTKIPIFILVDADPYGIEIMCTYKFGSFSKIFNAEQFAVPSIRYIGMWPSDMDNMNCMVSDATPEDLKKTDEILERPYVCGRLREELFWLKTRKKKAEIECLYEQSMSYLFNNYIPTKIVNLEPLEIETQQLSQKMQDFNG